MNSTGKGKEPNRAGNSHISALQAWTRTFGSIAVAVAMYFENESAELARALMLAVADGSLTMPGAIREIAVSQTVHCGGEQIVLRMLSSLERFSPEHSPN
jgi:hypothetical protein